MEQKVKEILEKALFDLQDLPESPYNKSARADLWYALRNHQMLVDSTVSSDTLED